MTFRELSHSMGNFSSTFYTAAHTYHCLQLHDTVTSSHAHNVQGPGEDAPKHIFKHIFSFPTLSITVITFLGCYFVIWISDCPLTYALEGQCLVIFVFLELRHSGNVCWMNEFIKEAEWYGEKKKKHRVFIRVIWGTALSCTTYVTLGKSIFSL